MGKIKYAFICFMVFSIMAHSFENKHKYTKLPSSKVIIKNTKDDKKDEYTPKITFKDVIESQVGVIKEVMHLKNKTKKLSKDVKDINKNITNLQINQQKLSQKVSLLEKEIKTIKEKKLKGFLVEENAGGSKNVGFGKPNRKISIIRNGPQYIYFCVKKGVSYLYKEPFWKSIKMGASYKGDTLQCLTPCGLEGNRYYWIHVLNLRTGYKGYSILNGDIKIGKCK